MDEVGGVWCGERCYIVAHQEQCTCQRAIAAWAWQAKQGLAEKEPAAAAACMRMAIIIRQWRWKEIMTRKPDEATKLSSAEARQ